MEKSVAGISCQMSPLFSVPGLIDGLLLSAYLEQTRSSFTLLERGRSFILISPQSPLRLR